MKFYYIMCLLLVGCGSFTVKPYEERVTQSTLVTWTTYEDEDVEKECIKAGVEDPGPLRYILACVKYDRKACSIITGKTTTMEILGHELRHCFEGSFHN